MARSGSATALDSARRRSRVMTSPRFQELFEAMVTNMGTVIKGKEAQIRLVLTAVLAEGHVLLEDMPGTGKTMLARTLAHTLGIAQSRVQCTPDLLPTDVTGASVVDMKTREFMFREGPVFTNVLLVDEINRATPKTQSALLEAMAEKSVSVDGVTHPLPKPFVMIATQNPVEQAGTFSLPEAQLDRFLFKLTVGYADVESEIEVLQANFRSEAIERVESIASVDEVLAMQDWPKGVTVPDAVMRYIAEIVQATRSEPSLMLAASTRASLALLRASRVIAAADGREDVYPDDVKAILGPVLAHRMMLSPEAELREETVPIVIERITNRVKPPMAPGQRAH